MTVGNRIKQRRIELGLTQSELAARMGYSGKTSVCMAEKSGDNITTTKVKKFAEALDVSFRYLMGLDEQIEQAQKQLEPYAKQLAEIGKQISDKLSYNFDLQNGLKVEVEEMAQYYEPEQLVRAFNFAKAFLSASPERQKIALEILQQSHQEDS